MRYVIILISLLVSSCGGSDRNNSEAISDKTPIVQFGKVELQTETNYSVEITNIGSLDANQEPSLKLMTESDDEVKTHELSYQVIKGVEKIVIQYSLARTAESMVREQPMVLALTLPNSTSTFEHKIVVWDLPRVNELNMPQIPVLTGSVTVNELDKGGSVYFYWLNLAPWNPPQNPTWQEDPYNNISWRLFYHSLGWLSSYVELYERTQDEYYRTEIQKYLKDYDETFQDPFNTHIALAYREDAVSVRVNHLLYIYLKMFKDESEEERQAIESLINKDIEMLQVYLDQEVWDNKNHGLIQARSALNLVVTFPFHQDISQLEESAHRRITALSELLFSPEGYVIEQSTGYHFVGLAMMLEAKVQLDTFGMMQNEALMNKIAKALGLAPYLLYEDGTMPANGDTSFGKKGYNSLARYYAEYGLPISELERFFEIGHSELEDLKVIEDEGVVIAKHSLVDENMSKVFFDVGKARLIHGHYDQLSIVASLTGELLLVDSGGPYTYSKAGGRDRWRYRSAHNTLVVNNDEIGDYSATLINSYENSDNISASGRAKVTDGLVHNRAFTLTKESLPVFIVVDVIENTSQKNLIEEYWHFAPKSVVEPVSDQHSKIILNSGKVFNQYKYSNNLMSCESLEGVLDAEGVPLIGWVTPRYNTLERAPFTKCDAYTSSYAKVNIFTEQAIGTQLEVEFSSNEILIKFEGRQYRFSIIQQHFIN